MDRPDQIPAPLYKLEEWPPLGPTLVLAAQWLVMMAPGLLVLGEVLADAWGMGPAEHVAFLQRLFLVVGLVQAGQILLGHRLPALVGPSTVLLVGVLSTLGQGPGAVYGAMALGGALTALLGLFGMAGRLARLYTPAVLASTLMLIAVSLAPTLRNLIYPLHAAGLAWGGPTLFAFALTLALLWGQDRLPGLWGSSILLTGLLVGSLAYHLLGFEPWPTWRSAGALGLPHPLWAASLSLDWPVLAAFLMCYLALVSNELGTVESLVHLLRTGQGERRVNRAVLMAGVAGLLGGLSGTLGSVSYSTSPGAVITTRNQSRFTFLPAALALMVLGLWPGGLGLFDLVPAPVVGAVLLAIMSTTVFAAISLLASEGHTPSTRNGLVVGLASTVGLIISFLPSAAREALHPLLRPILANGFVVGLSMALIMDHIVLRRPRPPAGPAPRASQP
ncbi:MAG: purine/pyrimidine permease [Deltaproteobacteria bacterium]|nr:purine/pyrimidine permease [Deltaproteobacteria bacterium]